MNHIDKIRKDLEQEYKKKIEKLEQENTVLKKENIANKSIINDLDRYHYRDKYNEEKQLNIQLNNENVELKKKLKSYEELLGIATISLNKDSSNSCKPSSTDGYKQVVQNNRIKTGRKPGRENGHKKSSKDVSTNPDIIKRVNKVVTCVCGHKTQDTDEVCRDVISIKIQTITTQYRGMKTKCPCCNKEYMPKFPQIAKTTVNYDTNVKSMITYLNSYCNMPTNKVSEFLNVITDKKISISEATVTNTISQFATKSQKIISNISKSMLNQPVLNEDETPIKVNGKNMSVIGLFTEKLSLLTAFANRKKETFNVIDIFNKYTGTMCHDHNIIHQNFDNYEDAECGFHILRYCKAEYAIHNRKSIKGFIEYMLYLKDKVGEMKRKEKTRFTTKEYTDAKKHYLLLLNKWDKEFEENVSDKTSKYYNSEIALKKRLREFVDDHLRFLTDFRIDFTNNLAERGLRKIKTKLKVMGSFRSLKSAQNYSISLSIIDSLKKQSMNIMENIQKIFLGKTVNLDYT